MTIQTAPFLAQFARKPKQSNQNTPGTQNDQNRDTKFTRVDRETTDDR